MYKVYLPLNLSEQNFNRILMIQFQRADPEGWGGGGGGESQVALGFISKYASLWKKQNLLLASGQENGHYTCLNKILLVPKIR